MTAGVELRYRIVDVFTDRPLAGNALCVVLDPCPDPVMRAIAREVNLSETTFPTVIAPDAYEMRIFTPASELPFAGHPSIGTAWVLGPGRWSQTTAGATVSVEAGADGAVMEQPTPVFDEVDASGAVSAVGVGAGRAWVGSAAGLRHLILPRDEPIEGLRPDLVALEGIAGSLRCTSVAVVRPLDDDTLHVRVFAPGEGIPEDPATGAAAGPVAVLCRRLWSTSVDVTILQGSEIGRPSRIEVHAEEGAVRVGGRVVPCAEGRFTL